MPDGFDRQSLLFPDPSIATNDAVARAAKSERDYVDGKVEVIVTRLNAIDEITRGLAGSLERMPGERQAEILHLRELQDEKFDSVQTQFRANGVAVDAAFAAQKEAAARQDEANAKAIDKSEKAVDVAFAAQKEAATKQDEANAKAIDKSERATAETITTNQALVTSRTDALVKSLDEVKLQISKIESTKAGIGESTASNRANIAVLISVAFFVITIVGIILTFIPKK